MHVRYLLIVFLVFATAACSRESISPNNRAAIGTVPENFTAHPIATPTDAAAYVGEYIKALGIDDVRVYRILGFSDHYFVYAEEAATGRGAFTLVVATDGAVKAKRFPAMDPEMMWNEKYGHRARRNAPSGDMKVTLDRAKSLAGEEIKPTGAVSIDEPKLFYGYYLFPISEAGKLAGEVAVNGSDGRVVWARFPEPVSFSP